MDEIFTVLFEGALLFYSAIPVRHVYDILYSGHSESQSISDLLGDLKKDWDTNASSYPLKMIGPFIEREGLSPDYLIASSFTEVAAVTTQVDLYWMRAAYCYLLKKHLMSATADEADIKFSREILGIFSADSPILKFLESVSNGRGWTQQAFRAKDDTMSFEEWAATRLTGLSPGVADPFLFEKQTRESAETSGFVSINDEVIQKWELFSRTLKGIS